MLGAIHAINLRRTLRLALLFAGLSFFLVLIWHGRHEFSYHASTTTWHVFLPALGLALLSNLLLAIAFSFSLEKYCANVGAENRYAMYFFAQIIKYVPGKIWSFAYQLSHITTPRSSSAVFLANIELSLCLLILISTASAAILLFTASPIFALATVFLSVFFCAWALKSCVLINALKRTARAESRLSKYLGSCHPIATNSYSASLLIALFLLAYICSHVFALVAVFGFDYTHSLTLTAFLGLSWVLGAVAFVSPAGLGIRELAFIVLATRTDSTLSLETLAAVAVFFRLFMLLQDLLGVILFQLWLHLRKRGAS